MLLVRIANPAQLSDLNIRTDTGQDQVEQGRSYHDMDMALSDEEALICRW